MTTVISSRQTGQEHAEAALDQYWGFQGFRPGQLDIVLDVLRGDDVLAVMPTGGGKSLCYGVPAVILDGITVVVSPLLALMADQVQALRGRGVKAEQLNGSMSLRMREHAWSRLEHGGAQMLFVSPETLMGEIFQARARRLNITRVAVDEAHCISEWGHDFRPAYRGIRGALDAALPARVPLMAVTATAPPRVRDDICTELGMSEPTRHVWPIDRPNITWQVRRTENLFKEACSVLSERPGSAVLYAGTRRNAEAWARRLEDQGVSAAAYHAGMDRDSRKRVQDAWMAGGCRVVAATSAFGMGIDKPDVRVVLHTMLPGSLEAYFQEAGRAGRDGLPSVACLIAPAADNERVRNWAAEAYPPSRLIRRIYDVVCDLEGLAAGSSSDDAFRVDISRVSAVVGSTDRLVRTAMSLIAGAGLWIVQEVDEDWVRVDLGPASEERTAGGLAGLRAAVESHDDGHPVHRLADALLRLDESGSATRIRVRTRDLVDRSGLAEERVAEGLRFFERRGLIESAHVGATLEVQLIGARQPRPDVDAVRVRRLRKRAASRAEDVIAYADTVGCRRRVLLNYFGEEPPARCGNCDNCLNRYGEAGS